MTNEIEALRKLVDRAIHLLENCEVSSGYCCCGDSMDIHSGPMTCDHCAVDSGAYYANNWLSDARATLVTKEPT